MSEMETQSPVADTTAPMNDNGSDNSNDNFESTAIPETYKGTWAGKYKNLGEAFRGGGEADKLIGAKGVIVPGDNAKPEDVEKFYNTLGRPAKADGYKFDPIDNPHEKIRGNPDLDKNFKAMAYKHGLTQKQASAMYKDYIGGLSKGLTKSDEMEKADTDKARAELTQEWGAEYDTKINKVKSIVEKYGGPDALKHFNEKGYGRDPIVLKTWANISKNFAEDSFVRGDNVVPSDVADAQKKIKDIMDDKAHPFWVSGKGHDEAVVEVSRLQEIITPNERKQPE